MVSIGYDRSFDTLPAVLLATSITPGRPGGGWRRIQLDTARRSVTLPQDVGLDFGGIAKGMAVDAALARLREAGIETALVNAGGDLALLGVPSDAGEWQIAVPGKDTSWSIPLEVGAKVAFILGLEQGADFLRAHRLAGLLVREDARWETVAPWPAHLMREEKV